MVFTWEKGKPKAVRASPCLSARASLAGHEVEAAPAGGLGAEGAVLVTVTDLAQVSGELIHVRSVLMPSPACGRERPKAKGKKKL